MSDIGIDITSVILFRFLYIIVRSVSVSCISVGRETSDNIYGYYVLNTAISFEYKVPDLSEFTHRIESISSKYPYYVAVIDNKIVGYAYANAFGVREAYKFSVELSVYIDKDYKKRGIGRLLYNHLEKELKKSGITNLYARVVVSDVEDEYISLNSLLFHKHLGFKQVGELHKCGYKFNRWYNVVYMEKFINEYP